jgi:hypothetical protein
VRSRGSPIRLNGNEKSGEMVRYPGAKTYDRR